MVKMFDDDEKVISDTQLTYEGLRFYGTMTDAEITDIKLATRSFGEFISYINDMGEKLYGTSI